MRFLSDSRAQSVQVGAVILFGVLIVLLSTWQAFVIPDQNEGIEFNHNGEVQQQMTELRSTVLSMPGADTTRSVTVTLGLRYPSRTVFMNPPPVSGTLQTLDTTDPAYNITIANAQPGNDDLAQLWAQQGSQYNTGAIEYSPSYNQYQSAPRTIYAHSVLYNKFDREDQQLPITGQSLVRDDTISIVTLNGTLTETRVDSTSVDFEPVSTRTREVEIAPDGGPITLELPTRLSESRWETLLATEQNIENVSVDQSAIPDEELGLLRVELADGANAPDSYTLQLSKVGIGTSVTQEQKAYVTDVAGNGSVIQTSETQAVTIEVRNRYNKPITGADIQASAEGGVFGNENPTTSASTDSDGQATLQYTGTVTGDNSINVTIESFQPTAGNSFDATTPTNLTTTVTVNRQPTSGGGGGGSGAYNVTWVNPETGNSEVTCSPSSPDPPETCTIDAQASSYSLDLTMETDPVADGADVTYSVSNQTVGTVSPQSGTTDSAGTDTTTLTVTENGTVNTYVNSGSSGDRIEFTVENIIVDETTADFTFSPTNPGVGESVEFNASTSSTTNGSITSYDWDFGDGTTGTGEVVNHNYSSAGTYTVTLTVTDSNGTTDSVSKDVTVRAPALFTAVGPNPDDNSNDDTEFVRVQFPANEDTSSWTIETADGDTVAVGSDFDGEQYFAYNKAKFVDRWGISASQVTDITTRILANSGDNLLLKDGSGTVRDEFGYNGETTSNGWDLSLNEGDVAVRETGGSGSYIDTDAASDWRIESEDTFFSGEDTPALTAVTVENAPLNQSDTGVTHSVTLQFNQTMDTSVQPTVGLSDLGSSGTYNSSLASNGAWVDDTTWQSEFTLADDDEDVTSTIDVADAKNQFGETMNRDTSNTFVVDTREPNDPGEVRINTDPININNQDSVSVDVDVDNPDDDGGTVFVRIADNDGNTVTASGPLQSGSGTVTTTITGIDVTPLNDDNSITARARVVDDLANENPSGFTAQSNGVLKDTQRPTIERFNFTNNTPSTDELTVEIDSSEKLDTISVEIEDSSGTVVATLTEADITNTDSTNNVYTLKYNAPAEDTYTAILRQAEDQAGNDGAGSETDTATYDTTSPTFQSASAEGQDTNNDDKNIERVVFTFDTTDNIEVQRVTVRAFDGGTTLGTNSTTSQTDTLTIDNFGSAKTNGNGNFVDVELQVTDTSGNSRTCEGTINSEGEIIRKSQNDFTCSSP
ncbi:PKD domain-containing protein [Halovenus halobia]|uniref:PKD domain-containing protein n=1 Tax=Halovenus halobia TaxID=3396622 RepID=UPI003F571324